jgi:hypothetical protein
MLLKDETIAAIREGRVTLLFRRWKTPRAKAGGRSRDARGVVEVVSVARAGRLTERDARAAGHPSLAALREDLARHTRADAGGELYRIEVRWGGEDPRRALRGRAKLGAGERAELVAKLARLDARSRDGPWVAKVLGAIAEQPGVVSTTLAAQLGLPRADFKQLVRKLKELGLTESLEIGYRISPRGRAVLGELPE